MTHKEIRLGRSYWMKVSGQLVPVTVEQIRERFTWHGSFPTGRAGWTYICTNQRTGHTCKALSASKFRGEVE